MATTILISQRQHQLAIPNSAILTIKLGNIKPFYNGKVII